MTLDTTTLTIGPLRVIISANDRAVHTALQSAYRVFAADAAPVPYALTAHVAYTSGPAPADWPFAFEVGVLRFTAAHYTGSIDVRRANSHLQVTAPHPFEPIDYFLRAAMALLAFEAGGLLFHAAGLAQRGKGYAFFGHSGSGKTTVARVSAEAVVLNDDLVVLLPQAKRWLMYATPFSNPTQVTPAGPQSVPLHALYRLVQDRRVFLGPIDPAVAVAEVIANSPVVSADLDRAVNLLARAEHLVTSVPVQRLHFLPDPSFWAVVQP
jgi:hypothetical protein